MGRGVAHAGQRRACLQIASTPEVPFCAAARMATAFVLARRSVPERVRSIADSAWWRRAGARQPYRIAPGDGCPPAPWAERRDSR